MESKPVLYHLVSSPLLAMVDRDQAIEYALKEARDNDVKFIRLWFTDILGNLKGFAITVEELETALTRGMGIRRVCHRRVRAGRRKRPVRVPDPNTFAILPWRPRENAVARGVLRPRHPGRISLRGATLAACFAEISSARLAWDLPTM